MSTASDRPPHRSPAPASAGRFHRSNLLEQKARGPLRPQILYRDRDQSRADPRPAWVRISMPKQRPRRGKHSWQTLFTSSSDVYPCPKIFAARLPRRTLLAPNRQTAWLPPPGLQTDRPCLIDRFHRSNPLGQKARGPLRPQILYRGRDQSQADPRPALVRISLPKQRPRRRGHLLETILPRPVMSTHI